MIGHWWARMAKVLFPDRARIGPFDSGAEMHEIELCSLRSDYVNFLIDLLPNITSLTVSIRSSVNDVTELTKLLLGGWRNNLVSLKISTCYLSLEDFEARKGELYEEYYRSDQVRHAIVHRELVRVVNSIGSLRSLHLSVASHVTWLARQWIQFPALQWLHEFYFFSAEDGEELVDSLIRYGADNPQLRNVAINNRLLDFDQYLALPPELSRRFLHISISLGSQNAHQFRELCSHFTNLVTLQLDISSSLSLSPLLVYLTLSSLSQLVHLTYFLDDQKALKSMCFSEHQATHVPHCPSVKVLTLNLFISTRLESHSAISSLLISRVFPKLQVVRFNRCDESLCKECVAEGVKAHRYGEVCLRAMVKPFGACHELYLVKTGKPDHREWTREELL